MCLNLGRVALFWKGSMILSSNVFRNEVYEKDIGRKVASMARAPNKKVEEAHVLYKKGMKLVDIATKLDIPPGTVRRWKSAYQWESGQQSERSERKSERSQKGKANVRKENEHTKVAVNEENQIRMPADGLTEKQQMFCLYFVKYRNKVKAYQKAFGCSYENACGHASALSKKVEIQNEINRLLEEYRMTVKLDTKDLFQWYLDIARADITDYAEFGSKDIAVINKDTGEQEEIAVSYVNLKDSREVDGTLVAEVSKGRDGVKLKLADRMKALQWLSDHIGIATEKQRAEIELLKSKTKAEDSNQNRDAGREAVKFYMPDNGRGIKEDESGKEH